MFNKPSLIQMIPAELRATLRENDHIFIEALRVEVETVHLRIWGYGPHDNKGFRWSCTYEMREARMNRH